MGLRNKQQPEQPAGRRRLHDDYQSERPQAFSYYARRAASEANTGRSEPEAARLKPSIFAGLRTQKSRLIAAVSLIGAAVVVIFLSSLSAQPKIALIQNTDSAYFLQSPETYAATAQKVLHSSWFNKSKLTVDTTKVAAELKRSYPEIKNATVVLPVVGTAPTVYIEPYRPAFIVTTTSSSAFLLDENGRALVSVSQITDTGELSVPTIQDKSSLVAVLGKQVLPRTTIDFIEEVLRVLEVHAIEESSIVLPPGSSELHIGIAGKPYFVKFNLQGDARQQAGTYVAMKQRLEKDRTAVAQYVDVRVPERAYLR